MFLERIFEVLDFYVNLNIKLDLQSLEFSCITVLCTSVETNFLFLSGKSELDGYIT